MKKILFLIMTALMMLQGCSTAPEIPKTAAVTQVTAPVVAVKKEVKAVELDPLTIMTNPNLGNCTACHSIAGRPEILGGNIGPPFVGMKYRFTDFDKLVTAINDQRALSPQTLMPPFGRNKILTPEQINAVAKFIYQY